MRVLVTGGRTWLHRQNTYTFLDVIHAEVGITLLIHGNAKGADRLCRDWAIDRDVEHLPFVPDWDLHGKTMAGKIRNQEMLDQNPDVLVSFPGQGGTADMKTRARKAGVEIWDWTKWKSLQL